MRGSARHISVVTGSRAEYGLLRWLMAAIRDDRSCRLSVIATGAHLSDAHGRTISEIEADGFEPLAVPCLDGNDSRLGTARALARATEGVARTLAGLSPDVAVVLGDRYEILGAAQAALMLGIPLAHIHGGEITEGAMDDAIRHAITKMAHLHFAAAEPYARRIVAMGEAPDRVFTVGALGVEAVAASPKMALDALSAAIGLELSGGPVLLVTYHPVTMRKGDEAKSVAALLAALEQFPESRVVITGANADTGHKLIATLLRDHANRHPGRVALRASLGQRRYIALMRHAAAVIGNSSSGLIEAPACRVPTVDIGDRQKGRLRAASVIGCEESSDAIATAIALALDPAFRRAAFATPAPYGGGGTAQAILAALKAADLAAPKTFFDSSPGGGSVGAAA